MFEKWKESRERNKRRENQLAPLKMGVAVLDFLEAGELEHGSLELKYDSKILKIFWAKKCVYKAKKGTASYDNSVWRFNYGDEWYNELVELNSDIASKKKRKHIALFADLN